MREPLPLIDIMKLSDEETELLTDMADPEEAAKVLNKNGISMVAVTLGKDGALVCTGNDCRHVSGYEVAAIDTTGAGDAFWGGFLYKLLKSGKSVDQVDIGDLETFARFGNATAAICVGRRGGIPAMPTLQEAEKLFKENRKI
jgi:fructokinase